MPTAEQVTIIENLKTARDLVRQVQSDQEFTLSHYNLKPDGRRVMTESQPVLKTVIKTLDGAIAQLEGRRKAVSTPPVADGEPAASESGPAE